MVRCRGSNLGDRADLLEAAHMLFPAAPDDAEATARAKQHAAAALTEVLAAPQRFSDLARELSACSSAAQGGQITRGQTVPEFETFLFNLEPGQIWPVPVKTRFGHDVLRLDRRIDGRTCRPRWSGTRSQTTCASTSGGGCSTSICSCWSVRRRSAASS
jgi:parvulin-like peptidyl-prolyl isomerase